MKIQTEHYEHMKTAIDKLDKEKVQKHAEAVKESGKFKDYGKRMRWDLSYIAGLTPFFVSNVYQYANDEHIDTALKNIVSEIGFNF